MGYVVIESFSDMQDGGYTYNPGDAFPRGGVSVGQSRLRELSTAGNKLGRALIKLKGEAVAEPKGEIVAEPVVIPQETVSERPRKGHKKKD